MAGRLYGASGTLVGAPVTLNIQTANNWTAEYVEVHNLSGANTYTCAVNGATFSIPPGRKLAIPGFIADLTLNGTGAYSMYAAESSDTLPSLDNISQGSIGAPGSISPPDNVTIEDTGVVLQVKALGISTAKLANQAVNTSKLADLAGTFNKTGSGINQNPGRGACFIFDSTGVIVGDTLTVTFAGSPVIYEFTNGGAPAPGNIGVDIPTINVDLPAKMVANQVLLSCSALAGVFYIGYSVQSLIQAGTTLSAVPTGLTVVENIAAVGESRVGLEFHQYSITALNAATGYPIFTSGTIIGKWFIETVVGGNQLSTVGIGFTPLSTGDGIFVSGSGTPGNIMNVILAVQY